MDRQTILARLRSVRDEEYAGFQRRLIPNIAPESILGVRTPDARKIAREAAGEEDTSAFLAALPHEFFDENQVHAFVISRIKDFDACLAAVEGFLPYVDNWATCDQLSPQAFKKHRQALLPSIRAWLDSGETYTVRFALGMLMQHFLDEDFDPVYLSWAAGTASEEYYVRMMVAWYFATALAKQYDAAVPYLEQRLLPAWTHKKAIQKAVESYRILPERKDYLKSLR